MEGEMRSPNGGVADGRGDMSGEGPTVPRPRRMPREVWWRRRESADQIENGTLILWLLYSGARGAEGNPERWRHHRVCGRGSVVAVVSRMKPDERGRGTAHRAAPHYTQPHPYHHWLRWEEWEMRR
jgi:hypothetical protein